ncbi:MAG TPA: DMT family transporter [Burkholderiales bacterium]|jgi:drug/metabolite transporter (DMT)-like permease|nr:DMT family transporter [Burkholderiales bacterium]
MQHPKFATGVAFAFLAVVSWGAQFPIAKSAFAAVDPYHVSAIRYGVATLLLVPVVAAAEGAAALRYYGRAWPASVLGVIGMTCSPMLVFAGLDITRPEHAAIIVSLQPSMTAIADWWLRGRRPANFTIGCIVAAFAGVVLVVTRGNPALGLSRQEIVGDLLVLVGAACWVVYTMGTERFRGWSALKFTVLTLIPGSIGLAIATAVLVALGVSRVPTAAAVASVAPHLAFLALAGVAAAMILWNAGNQRIGALNSMLMLNLVPVVVFTIGFAQGQRFHAAEVVGAVLVIGALAANNLYLRASHARRPH